jgi:hypothetical protein
VILVSAVSTALGEWEWSEGGRIALYLIALLYMFAGVAIMVRPSPLHSFAPLLVFATYVEAPALNEPSVRNRWGKFRFWRGEDGGMAIGCLKGVWRVFEGCLKGV